MASDYGSSIIVQGRKPPLSFDVNLHFSTAEISARAIANTRLCLHLRAQHCDWHESLFDD